MGLPMNWPSAVQKHSHGESAQDLVQPTQVILVRMGQDDHLDLPLMEGERLADPPQRQIRIDASIDQRDLSIWCLDENRVALTDVEDGQMKSPIRSSQDRGQAQDQRHAQSGATRARHPAQRRAEGRGFGQRNRRSGYRREWLRDWRSGRGLAFEAARPEAQERIPGDGQPRPAADREGGQRHIGGGHPHTDESAQREPRRSPGEPFRPIRNPGERYGCAEGADDRGQGRTGHYRRHQRDDGDVGQGCDQRDLLERGEQDGERGQLRRDGQRHRRADPSWPARQAPLQRGAKNDQPARGQRRQLEPDVPQGSRRDDQHDDHRRHER